MFTMTLTSPNNLTLKIAIRSTQNNYTIHLPCSAPNHASHSLSLTDDVTQIKHRLFGFNGSATALDEGFPRVLPSLIRIAAALPNYPGLMPRSIT